MTNPRYRLETLKESIRNTPGNDAAQRTKQMEVSIDCAVEVAEALMKLADGAQAMGGQLMGTAESIGRSANAIRETLTEATDAQSRSAEQIKAEIVALTSNLQQASMDIKAAGAQSSSLSRRLNTLTGALVFVALTTAGATGFQAWEAKRQADLAEKQLAPGYSNSGTPAGQASIWERSKECADQSEKLMKEWHTGLDEKPGKTGIAPFWEDHYSPKYRRCLLVYTREIPSAAAGRSGLFEKTLFDPFERRPIAATLEPLPPASMEFMCQTEDNSHASCSAADNFIEDHMKQ